MKKLLKTSIMPLITVFALTSCGETPSITPEVAKQRAADIQTKQASSDFSLPTKVSTSTSSEAKVTSNGSSSSATISYTTEMDLDNFYFHNQFHIVSAGRNFSVDVWNYFQASEKAFYTVYQSGTDTQLFTKLSLSDNQIESMSTNYQSILKESIKTFSSINSSVNLSDLDFTTSLKELSINSTGLEQIVDFAKQAENGKIEIKDETGQSDFNLSGSYSIDKLDFRSSGDGSLEAWLDGTLNLAVSTYTSSSKLSASIVFKDYLFSSSSLTYSVTSNANNQTTTASITHKTETKYDVKVNKPTIKDNK